MTIIDARGKSCPMPIVLTAKAIRGIEIGAGLSVLADDRAFPSDVEAWCKKTGNALVSLERKSDYFEAEIRRAR